MLLDKLRDVLLPAISPFLWWIIAQTISYTIFAIKLHREFGEAAARVAITQEELTSQY